VVEGLIARRRVSGLVLVAVVVVVCGFVGVGGAWGATGYVHGGVFGLGPGGGAGELSSPKRVGVDVDGGNVFVVDSANNRVQVFGPSGGSAVLLSELGGLSDPFGVAVDQGASPVAVYVADAGNGRIVRFVSDGAGVPSFSVDPLFVSPGLGSGVGEVGDFHAPLAVDPATGDLLVGDPGSSVVKRFTSAGVHVSNFDGSDSPEGAFSGLADLAVTAAGEVVVVDGGGRVGRYSSAGVFEATLLAPGVFGARVVGVDPNNGNVVVGHDTGGSFLPNAQLAIFAGDGLIGNVVLPAPGLGFSDPVFSTLVGVGVDGPVTGRALVVTDATFGFAGQVGVQVFDPGALADLTIDPPANIEEFSVDLAGSVNPAGGAGTTAQFELSSDGTTWTPVGSPHDESTDPGLDSGSSPVAIADAVVGLSQDTHYFVRLTAASPGGEAFSVVEEFTTDPVTPPTALVTSADAGGESVDLAGDVNPQGFETTAQFEYSVDDGDSSDNTWTVLGVHDSSTDPGLADSTGDVPITDRATGLVANTDYLVRIVATNAGGSTTSPEVGFHTDPLVPVVGTLPAGGVSQTGAQVGGTVNPKNSATVWWVQYGTTPAYGTSLPVSEDADAGAGNSPVTLAQQLEGLEPGTVYHFRVVAQNQAGTAEGADQTFETTTPPRPQPARCPNDKFRQPGSLSAGLGECRAYERVSPVDKNGVNVEPDGRMRASDDGTRVSYQSFGNFAGGGGSSPYRSQYMSLRQADGWVTRNLNPPYDPDRPRGAPDSPPFEFDQHLSRAFTRVEQSDKHLGGPTFTLWAYQTETDVWGPIARPHTSLPETGSHFDGTSFGGATTDFRRVAVEAGRALTPDTPPALENGFTAFLYEYTDSNGLRLASILPNGEVAPGGVTLGAGRRAHFNAAVDPGDNAMSADGQRIYFTTNEEGLVAVGPRAVYLRQDPDLDGPTPAQTIQVDASERSTPDPNGDQPSFFQVASADGRYAFFTSGEKLTDDANAGNGECGTVLGGCDLYRFDAQASEGERLTNLTSGDPDGGGTGGNLRNPEAGGVVGASSDGSRAFFVARGDLAPGATDGQPNLYLWQQDTGVQHITTLNATQGTGDSRLWTMTLGDRPRTANWTADAGRLLFRSNARVTAYDNNGRAQLYLYDVQTNRITCVSCNPNTPQSAGDAHLGVSGTGCGEGFCNPSSRLRNLSGDGQRVVFLTSEALVGQDTNRKLDVYQWDDGNVQLVTTGTSDENSFFTDASTDHNTIFITTFQRLTAHDNDNLNDIYAATINGGLPDPQPPADCPTDGTCKPGPPPGPNLTQPQNPNNGQPGNDTNPRPKLTTKRLTKRQLNRLAKGHKITITIRITTPGTTKATLKARLAGKQRTIAKATKTTRTPTTTTLQLQLKPTPTARKHLKNHHTPLHIQLTIHHTNTPTKTQTHTHKPPPTKQP
jgi:hypothetical protein